jgi:kinesin family member C2/C3
VNGGFNEALVQVQQEVEELRRQNGDLRSQVDYANEQIKNFARKEQAWVQEASSSSSSSASSSSSNNQNNEANAKSSSADSGLTEKVEVKTDDLQAHAEMARKVSDLENDRKKLIALLFEAKERLKEGPHRTPSPAVGASSSSSSNKALPPPPPPSTPAENEAASGKKVAPPNESSTSSSSSSSSSLHDIEALKSTIETLEIEVANQKANVKKLKGDKKTMKKDFEDQLAQMQNEARESEQKMVSAMEAEVQNVLAEKEAEYEKQRGGDLKLLKKLKKASAGQSKALSNLKAGAADLKLLTNDSKEAISKDLLGFKALTADTCKAIVSKVNEQSSTMSTLAKNYRREYEERRKLFNLVQELRGNIRVFCRCRPPSARELERDDNSGGAVCVSFPEEGCIRVENDRGNAKQWEFDQMFDFKAQQSAIYQEVSPLVTSVLDGYNACIFAYGQTGSGKTFTMTGPELGSELSSAENRGVNTRALDELFEKSSKRSEEVTDRIR